MKSEKGLVGGLPRTTLTGAGQTGTSFLQSEFSSQSWRQDPGVSERTQRESERRKKGKDTMITNRKWKGGESPYRGPLSPHVQKWHKNWQEQTWSLSAATVWYVMTHRFLLACPGLHAYQVCFLSYVSMQISTYDRHTMWNTSEGISDWFLWCRSHLTVKKLPFVQMRAQVVCDVSHSLQKF